MSEMAAIGSILLVVYYLLVLALLARISHWAHAAQEQLRTTNRLLADIARVGKGLPTVMDYALPPDTTSFK